METHIAQPTRGSDCGRWQTRTLQPEEKEEQERGTTPKVKTTNVALDLNKALLLLMIQENEQDVILF